MYCRLSSWEIRGIFKHTTRCFKLVTWLYSRRCLCMTKHIQIESSARRLAVLIVILQLLIIHGHKWIHYFIAMHRTTSCASKWNVVTCSLNKCTHWSDQDWCSYLSCPKGPPQSTTEESSLCLLWRWFWNNIVAADFKTITNIPISFPVDRWTWWSVSWSLIS